MGKLESWKVGKFWEKVYFESLMSKTANSKKIVLMSEENMLGRCIDACQINPYQDSSFSRILDFSHASDSLSLFLSLRSTERVFPGSFTTVLRFNPSLAFKIRNQLVESLNLGQRPSWLPLIKRLNREFNKASLSIWNYDQYVNKSSYFIKKVIGQEDLMIPEIQRPQSTQTPSHKAIEMIQARLKIYNSYNSIEWTTMCDDIFCEYPSSQTEERYTFLTPNHIKYCKEQYKDDWEQLQTEESLNCFLI